MKKLKAEEEEHLNLNMDSYYSYCEVPLFSFDNPV